MSPAIFEHIMAELHKNRGEVFFEDGPGTMAMLPTMLRMSERGHIHLGMVERGFVLRI